MTDEPWSDTLQRIHRRASERAYGAPSESIERLAAELIQDEQARLEAVERHERDLEEAAARPAREKLLGEIAVIESCLRDESPAPPVRKYLMGRLNALREEL